jgi:hypothetical protein
MSEVIRELDFFIKQIGRYKLIGCYECGSLFFSLSDFNNHKQVCKKLKWRFGLDAPISNNRD